MDVCQLIFKRIRGWGEKVSKICVEHAKNLIKSFVLA